jgi:hypothetical protein
MLNTAESYLTVGQILFFFKKKIYEDFYDILLHIKKIPNRILKVQIK